MTSTVSSNNIDVYSLVIACNYDQGNTSVSPLKGCINDAYAFIYFLKTKYEDKVKINTLMNKQVTVENVKIHIQNFVYQLNEKKEPIKFILYYAGHGVSVYDHSGDEEDGYDEAIVCYNGQTLVDDWFYENFITKLSPHVQCFLINDCCRSGSIYDLPVCFSFHRNKNCMEKVTSSKHALLKEDSIKASCIGISGCADSQFSMEFSESKDTVRGVFTSALIHAWTKKDIDFFKESCVSLGNRIQKEMDIIWKQKFGYPVEFFNQFVNVSTTPSIYAMHITRGLSYDEPTYPPSQQEKTMTNVTKSIPKIRNNSSSSSSSSPMSLIFGIALASLLLLLTRNKTV